MCMCSAVACCCGQSAHLVVDCVDSCPERPYLLLATSCEVHGGARTEGRKSVGTLNSATSDVSADFGGADEAETTGRYTVVFRDDAYASTEAISSALGDIAGISSVASASDFTDGVVKDAELGSMDAAFFPELGVATVACDEEQLQALQSVAVDRGVILSVEPEYIYHALSGIDDGYLRGYRDAVNHLYDQLVGERGGLDGTEFEAEAVWSDTARFTWGLQATRTHVSRYSGRGVRIAVLDTGFDLKHPDFQGRSIIGQSFISGQAVQDLQSHGTHCVGTAAGPKAPKSGVRRYGCAYEGEIVVGKVLSNSGSSVGSSVLSGMNWAVAMRCNVISMSLGANVDGVSSAFETIGARALSAGCLIVAAAGNNAARPRSNGFVGQPANSPSIIAVGALDSRERIAAFSARSSAKTGVGGRVDIAAPGVSVFSSVPKPPQNANHASFNGTSMATPHVAGVAALWAQATGRRGRDLWRTVLASARKIPLSTLDVGAGIVQAP